MRWSPIPREVFDAVTASSSTQALPRESWPPFAQTDMRDVVAMWAWRTPEDGRMIDSTGDTFENVEGVFDLIRESEHPHCEWKAYRYVVKREDGQTLLSGPLLDVDYGHHTSHLPAWPLRRPPTEDSSE